MSRKKTHEEFLEQVKDRPFDVLGTYTVSHDKIAFRCHIDGHEWSATPGNILSGKGCPKCAGQCGNDVLEDHGEFLIIDISTKKFPDATMAVDADVWERHEGGRVSAFSNPASKYIYATYYPNGKLRLFHHDVIQPTAGLECDHSCHGNFTFVDNRRSNLRLATRSENCQNRDKQSNNTSGVTGLYWHECAGKWCAQIKINGKDKYLGLFDNIADAAKVRQSAEREHFGEYAFQGDQ